MEKIAEAGAKCKSSGAFKVPPLTRPQIVEAVAEEVAHLEEVAACLKMLTDPQGAAGEVREEQGPPPTRMLLTVIADAKRYARDALACHGELSSGGPGDAHDFEKVRLLGEVQRLEREERRILASMPPPTEVELADERRLAIDFMRWTNEVHAHAETAAALRELAALRRKYGEAGVESAEGDSKDAEANAEKAEGRRDDALDRWQAQRRAMGLPVLDGEQEYPEGVTGYEWLEPLTCSDLAFKLEEQAGQFERAVEQLRSLASIARAGRIG